MNLIADHEIDNRLIDGISEKTPNLEALEINMSARSADSLGDFPRLLQQTLSENWRNLTRFSIADKDQNFL